VLIERYKCKRCQLHHLSYLNNKNYVEEYDLFIPECENFAEHFVMNRTGQDWLNIKDTPGYRIQPQ